MHRLSNAVQRRHFTCRSKDRLALYSIPMTKSLCKSYPADCIFAAVISSIAIGIPAVIVVAGINSLFGTHTIVERYPGYKSLCTRMEFNYALKVSQCKEYVKVSTMCKRVEIDGPIFPTFISESCD